MTDAYTAGFGGVDADATPKLAQSPLDRVVPVRGSAVWIGGAFATALHAGLASAAGWLVTAPSKSSSLEPTWITQMVEVPTELQRPPPLPVAPPEPQTLPRPSAPVPRAAPAAAAAAQVLTQQPSAPEEIVEFDASLVQGTGVTYAGGVSATAGRSLEAVRDPGARAAGIVGGTGTDDRVIDRSRAPVLAGGAAWDCPFPREAEFDGVDSAVVTLSVRVSRAGSVEDVSIAEDPGSGFGREAMRCARSKRWAPGLDRAGNPVAMTSRIKVRFIRSN